MEEWISEKIIPFEGDTRLGAHGADRKSEEIMVSKLFIYPPYCMWCKRNGHLPYKPKKFSIVFIQTCKHVGIQVEKVRKANGISMKGIQVYSKVVYTQNKETMVECNVHNGKPETIQ